jgi:hypothetical protein
MDTISEAITALFNNIPRRHTAENVKEIYSIVDAYEDILIQIEAINSFYEKNIAAYFDDLETVRTTIKKSNDNKASKKSKDGFFDKGSGALKDSMESLLSLYDNGNRIA